MLIPIGDPQVMSVLEFGIYKYIDSQASQSYVEQVPIMAIGGFLLTQLDFRDYCRTL